MRPPPTILILLRSVRRELTLYERHADRPHRVSPMFSPDAQRIYFQSGRHGKPAIFSLHVERLVERIDEAGIGSLPIDFPISHISGQSLLIFRLRRVCGLARGFW
jgi:hypothetical protein